MVYNKRIVSMLALSLMAMPAMVLAVDDNLNERYGKTTPKHIVVGTVGGLGAVAVGLPALRYGTPAVYSGFMKYIARPIGSSIGKYATKVYQNNGNSIGKTIWSCSWPVAAVTVPAVIVGGLIYKYHPQIFSNIKTGYQFAAVKANDLGVKICEFGSKFMGWFAPAKK